MSLIYLKFANEAQAHEVLAAYMTRDIERTVNEETGEITETPVGAPYFIGKKPSLTHGLKAGQWELWVRGTLHATTGATTTDEEGNEVAVTAPLDGFHVDFDPKLGGHPIEEWVEAGYVVQPANPQFTK